MAIKFSLSIFLVFLLGCESNDINKEKINRRYWILGEWLSKEIYISPGGASEWQDAKKGFRYIFNNDGRYSKTTFNKEIKQRGDYQIKENELSLYFKIP